MKIKTVTAAIGLAVSSAHIASAASIALTNAGFESDAVPENGFTEVTPTGWTEAIGGLQFLGDGSTFPGISGGQGSSDQYFLAANGTGGIRQDSSLLWASLSAGDSLTIGTWTTYRNDINPETMSSNAYLWINDSNTSGLNSGAINVTTAGELGGGAAVAAGAWTQRSWTYTVTQADLDTAIDENWGAVEVQIGMIGGAQIAFDNVTLDYSPIPEPSGLALWGACLGITILRRKR